MSWADKVGGAPPPSPKLQIVAVTLHSAINMCMHNAMGVVYLRRHERGSYVWPWYACEMKSSIFINSTCILHACLVCVRNVHVHSWSKI